MNAFCHRPATVKYKKSIKEKIKPWKLYADKIFTADGNLIAVQFSCIWSYLDKCYGYAKVLYLYIINLRYKCYSLKGAYNYYLTRLTDEYSLANQWVLWRNSVNGMFIDGFCIRGEVELRERGTTIADEIPLSSTKSIFILFDVIKTTSWVAWLEEHVSKFFFHYWNDFFLCLSFSGWGLTEM